MKILIELMGATGVLLFTSGIPAVRRNRLSARVLPYLSGFEGRPSSLLTSPGSGRRAAIERLLQRYLGQRDGGEALASTLAAAGIDLSPEAFRVEQLTAGLAAVVVLWLVFALGSLSPLSISPAALPLLSLIILAFGFFGREWLLARAASSRRKRLVEQLPTAIDLMTLAIMAGESVAAALERTSGMLTEPIGGELRRVVGDVRAGSSTVEALEAFGKRNPVTAVTRLVDALCTALEKGSPLADVLRAQADDGRENRRRALLEMGGRREVLMLIPVVFLIMPVVVAFSLFPGLVSLDLLVP